MDIQMIKLQIANHIRQMVKETCVELGIITGNVDYSK